MNTEVEVLVKYVSRDGKPGEATVRVVYDEYDNVWSAIHLGLWGCGKNSPTIEGAVRLLVQDMATIVSITPV